MSGFIDVTSQGQMITVISVGLALMSLIVRKVVVDQEKFKKQREDMKELNKQMKEAQKEGDTKRISETYSKLMQINSEVMKQSFKPMIFTLIPFLLIFGWMRGSYDATMTNVVLVNPIPDGVVLKDLNVSEEGFYNQSAGMLVWKRGIVQPGNSSTLSAEFLLEGAQTPLDKPAALYYKSATEEIREPIESNKTEGIVFLQTVESKGNRVRITLYYNNAKSNIVAGLMGFELGWLGWYFICSMMASLILNKIFKVS
ncbi:MAG: EMC3/TMCO1 family protein [Candidatus Altiarchaeota archaeon]